MAGATVEILDRDGKPKNNIPQYALESTLAKLVTEMGKQTTQNANNANQARSDNSDIQRTFRDAIGDNGRDIGRNLGKVSESFGAIMKRHTRDLVGGMSKMAMDIKDGRGFLGGVFQGLLAATALTFKTFTGYMDDVRNTFSKLNQVGLNLSAGWGDNLSTSSMDVVQDFQKIGMSMEEVSTLMFENSFALATNRRSIMSTIKAFNSLTGSGVELGLSVKENADLILDELGARSEMLYQDQINADQEAAQVNDLINAQFRYTKALGKSIEEIRKSSQNIVKGSASSLSLIQLQGAAGAKTLTGLQTLASGLIGSGFGDEFAGAMVEAAAGIVPLIDESTQGYFATLGAAGVNLMPILTDLNNTAKASQLGVKKAEDFVDILTDSVANMSEQGIVNLRYMAAAGDPVAKQMLIMRASIERAKKSLSDLGRSAAEQDEMFKKIRTFDRALAEIGGMFAVMKQDLISNFSPFMEKLAEILRKIMLNQSFKDALSYFTDTVGKAIFGITGGLKDLNIDDFVAETMPKLVDGIKGIADFLADAITFVKEIFPSKKPSTEMGAGTQAPPDKEGGSFLGTFWGVISNIGGAVSDIVESPYFKTFLTAALGITALTVVTGKLIDVIGTSGALKAVSVVAGLGVAIRYIGEGLQQFNNVNAKNFQGVIDGIGGLLGIIGIGAIGIGVTGGMGALVAGGVAAGLAGTVALIGAAVRAFPLEELTKMTAGLDKISQVKTGVFSNLASEIKVLAVAIKDLTLASVGGFDVGDFIKGNLKTPVGLLADDLERLSNVAKTLPPGMTAGVGTTPVSASSATTASVPLAAASAAGTAIEPMTREQAILNSILLELKRSVSALNEIKIIEQQKLS